MTWVRLDDQFPEHPKVLRAGPEASWLHVAALCYCARQLTDGFVPSAAIGRLAEVKNPLALADRLASVGLWHRVEDGWQINDYLSFNPSREKVLAERAAAKERKERWVERKKNAVRNGVPNAGGTEMERSPRPQTRPGPKGHGSGSAEPRDAGSPPAADGGGEQFDPEVSKANAAKVGALRDELAAKRAALEAEAS